MEYVKPGEQKIFNVFVNLMLTCRCSIIIVIVIRN